MRGFRDRADTFPSAVLTPTQQIIARFFLGEVNAQAPYSQAASFELFLEGVTGNTDHHLDQEPLPQAEAEC